MDSYELALELGQKAKRRGVTVATAESCTAGGLGFEITAVPGSSEWYERGFITYTNRAKEEMLGVKAETLAAVWCRQLRNGPRDGLRCSGTFRCTTFRVHYWDCRARRRCARQARGNGVFWRGIEGRRQGHGANLPHAV